MNRWYLVRIALNYAFGDPEWQTALARKYIGVPNHWGVIGFDPVTLQPAPLWTLVSLNPEWQNRVKNDEEIIPLPCLDLTQTVSKQVTGAWETFHEGANAAGLDLTWVSGDHRVGDVVNWLGRQIMPTFDWQTVTL